MDKQTRSYILIIKLLHLALPVPVRVCQDRGGGGEESGSQRLNELLAQSQVDKLRQPAVETFDELDQQVHWTLHLEVGGARPLTVLWRWHIYSR